MIDGSLTPAAVFIRAETLDRLNAPGWAVLSGLGVRTVIDLRRPEEAAGAVPDDMLLLRVDLDGDEREFWEPFETASTAWYISDRYLQPARTRLSVVVGADG